MQDDNKKPTVEDQELADMIASMNGATPKTGTPQPAAPAPIPASPAPKAMSPNASTLPIPKSPPAPMSTSTPPLAPLAPLPVAPAPVPMPAPLPPKPPAAPAPPTSSPAPLPAASSNLGVIKKNALDELRPLVDRLDLPADEQFDTLLLLIRSTDDKTLIKPAYDAAGRIKDDTKRAQALLDIVKEIDFFENPVN